MTTDTTPAAIAAILDGVTPGPWIVTPDGYRVTDKVVMFDNEGARHGETPNIVIFAETQQNAGFIAAARELVPALAAENERLAKELASAQRGRDEWRDEFKALAAAIVGDTGLSAMTVAAQARLYRPRAEKAEAERDRLAAQLAKAETDCAMFADANARQAMCISFTAANLGPEYSATIEGLPKAARHVSTERDRLQEELWSLQEEHSALEGERNELRAENERLRAALDAHQEALIWCSGSADFNEGGIAEKGWRKVCASLLKGETP